jgi:hypothetical protein
MLLKEESRKKEEAPTDFDFAEILDRARDLNRELLRSRSDTREVEITVIDDSEVDRGSIASCKVTVVADTFKEAKEAKAHLEGKDHKCSCTRDGKTVTCTCP